MADDLPWGIHEQLGGLDATTAQDINEAEREAVLARRAHYAARSDLVPPIAPDQTHATALAISGGGIRSATFALGVLAALARRNLLYQFDYLSTVSGGGYLGAFLTTFLSADAPADDGRSGLGATTCRSSATRAKPRRCAMSAITANISRPAGCGSGCRWPARRSTAWR